MEIKDKTSDEKHTKIRNETLEGDSQVLLIGLWFAVPNVDSFVPLQYIRVERSFSTAAQKDQARLSEKIKFSCSQR